MHAPPWLLHYERALLTLVLRICPAGLHIMRFLVLFYMCSTDPHGIIADEAIVTRRPTLYM